MLNLHKLSRGNKILYFEIVHKLKQLMLLIDE